MKKVALLVQPAFDDATGLQAQYFNHIVDNITKIAQERGFGVVVLYGPKANRREFELALAEYDPKFIYFGGHGLATKIMGQDQDSIIQLGVNDFLLKGRLVYSFECDSASLIPLTSKARAFLGYRDKFYIYSDPKYVHAFMNLGFTPLLMLLQGRSFGEVFDTLKQMYEGYMSCPKFAEVKKYLEKNYNALTLVGDPEARF